MKMYSCVSKFLILILIGISISLMPILAGCNKDGNIVIKTEDNNNSISTSETPSIAGGNQSMTNAKKNKLQLSDIKFLAYDVSKSEILSKIGEPHRYIGSGISIGVYDSEDGKSIVLNYGSQDNKLKFAQLVYPDGHEEDFF